MTWRGRRRGVFEGLPRLMFHRTGERYVDACLVAIVVNGVVVAAFGVIVLVLYVDVHAGELAVFAACSIAAFVVEGLVGGRYPRRAAPPHARRAAAPIRAWRGGRREGDVPLEAWAAAARLPAWLVRRPSLYAIG